MIWGLRAKDGCDARRARTAFFCAATVSRPSSLGRAPGASDRSTRSGFHRVQIHIGCAHEGVESVAVEGVDGNPYADRQLRFSAVMRQALADAVGHQPGCLPGCLRQHKRKFVSAEARCGVDVSAPDRQNVRKTAKRLIADEMSVAVVDLLQSIQVKQQQRELPSGTLRSSDLSVDHGDKLPVVRQAGQGVLDCLVTELILQLALFGYIFGYDFVTRRVARAADDFPSAQSQLQAL